MHGRGRRMWLGVVIYHASLKTWRFIAVYYNVCFPGG